MRLSVTKRRATFALLAILFAGCAPTSEPTGAWAKLWNFAVGPKYRQPGFDAPPRFRNQLGPAEAASLADLPWWRVFTDKKLDHLISQALANNYDLQIAVSRVEQSRALIGVAASQFFPQAEYQGQAAREKVFFPGFPANPLINSFSGVLSVSWEIDVWGRIRHSTEAARADFLATEDARRGVMLTLVSNVAAAYFELMELDRELRIAQDSSETYSRTFKYFNQRYLGGTDTKLSTSRAEANLELSHATIADLERQIAQQEDAISVFLGTTPTAIERAELPVNLIVQMPPGLTTNLLKQRPDIMQAEHNMVSANAQVGVAVANFFPTIGLAALYGGQGVHIGDVVKNNFSVWNVAGNVTGPIFQGGKIYQSYRAQKAFWDETIEAYQGTIVESFREVSDALVAQDKLTDRRVALEKQVAALNEAVRLSLDRYNTGLANYFEVLDAEQQLYPAEDALAQTQRDQLLAVVSLYRALGGGWNLTDREWTAH